MAAGEAAKDAAATGDANRHSKHEESPARRPPSQRIDVPKQQPLPAKWVELKKEYDMRTGCGLQVDWNMICRETNASSACYGYLAGQLTNNIQASAKEKAAQLRQAVRDGWQQYRQIGPAAQARSEKPFKVIAESAEANDYKWVHAGCTAKPANQRFGLGSKPDQKQVYCKACGKQFWTKGKEPEQIAKQTPSPWACSKCRRQLSKDGFGIYQRTQGATKKCKRCLQ